MRDWEKIVGWTTITFGAVLLFAIAAGVLLLKSGGFHRYLVTSIEQQANEATGARVEVQNFIFHIKTLTADVYGVTIHGTEAPGQKPLLQVPHVRVGVKILSIFHRKVNLSELLIENPTVNLVVNQEGRSNLPEPPPKKSSSGTNVFDMAIGHVLLTNGEVQLKDRKIPVDANVFDLQTEIKFSQLAKKYSGTLAYQNGGIQSGQLKLLPHSLDARFDATPSELNLKPLVLRLGGSRLGIEASVRDYSSTPVASGRYDILLHTQDFAELAAAKTSGDVALSGAVNYREDPKQPMLKNVSLSGDLNSSGLAVVSPQAVLKIKKILGRYQFAGGTLRAQGFAFDLLDGQLTADATMENLDSTPRSRAHLALAGVSLQALKSSLRNLANQSMPVTGRLDGAADASWTGSLASVRAKSDLIVRGNVVTSNKTQSQTFPVNANVHVNYDAPKNLLTVPASLIQLPATSITAQGEIGDHSNLVVKATSTNLHQLMLLASNLSSSTTTGQNSNPSTLPNVQGAATLNAVIQGTLQNPKISAQLSANHLHVNQSEWSSLQLALSASPSEVSIQNGSLVSAKRGQLNFSGRAQLRRWSYVSSDPIAASLRASQLPLLELQQIASLQYPVEGDLVADLQISGSALNPEGQGKAQIVKARVYNEPVQNLSAQFQATRGSIQSTLNVVLPAGSATASLNYIPKTKAYEAKLDAPSLVLSKLHVVQAKNLPLNGTLTASVQGAGTLDDPKLVASLQLPEFKLRDTAITQVKTDLNVANHLAKFSLSSGVGPATLRGNGTVRIAPGYYTEASLDTSKFPLDPLLAAYVPSRPAGLHGETELHVSLRGPLSDKTKMEAHVTVPTLRATYESLEIANTAPIRLDYANSVVVLQPSGFKGTGTSIQVQGNIPVSGAARMNVSAHGSIDMRLIQMFSPDLHTQGTVSLDVTAKGTTKDPGLGGQIRLQNVSLNTSAAPVGLENFNATMQLTETGIQITNAAGQVAGGQITAGGSILYRPQLQMNVASSAKSVRLRYPDGMRTVFNSDLTLSGNRRAAVLQGRVLIDSLSFTSDFDIAAFMNQFTGTSAPPSPDSLAQNVKLEVSVQSSSQLTAGTSQLSVEGQANLRIIGTAADPVVVGRAILTSGDIFFNGHQFHLERGIITLVDPNQTKPVLNVLITTTIKQYNLSMSIVGPIDKLHTSYVSDPPLPPADVINLIARGQTTQEGAPTSFGANAILAAGLGQVGSNVSKLTGIAGFQIDPLIGGNNTNPSARIGFQQRVTKNFIFTFSTDVTQAQGEVVQGEYQLNNRWSVSVTRNESGGFAVNGRFRTNF